MMCYSVQPRDRIFIKGYGFLSFAKNMRKNVSKSINKIISGKYSQKLLGYTKQSPSDPLKTTFKKAIKKTPEATGDLTGNEIVDKISKT